MLHEPAAFDRQTRWRMPLLLGIALCNLFTFFGTSWDSQWHVTMGRESMWIPPHLVAGFSFAGGFTLALAAVVYEAALVRRGVPLGPMLRVGRLPISAGLLGLLIGFYSVVAFGFLDDQWHRWFGLDITLWSPPHWMMAASILVIALSLLLSLALAARGLRLPFTWRSAYFWAYLIAGASALAIVFGQLSEAFVVSFQVQGEGMMGLLFPILAGVLFPLVLVFILHLTGRFWAPLAILAFLLVMQLVQIQLANAALGFLNPVSMFDPASLLSPAPSIGLARSFIRLNGFGESLGLAQAWVISLSAAPRWLVALLGLWPWARRHLLVAAPVYSASLVLVSFLWFRLMPGMAAYNISLAELGLAALLAVAGGLLTGSAGLWLARRATGNAGKPGQSSLRA